MMMNNSDHIAVSYECGAVTFAANCWFDSTSCTGESRVVFEYFEDIKVSF